MNKITITIDNKKIKTTSNHTILEVAKENGIFIPSLCYHPDLTVKANCRLCLVQIKGEKSLRPSCEIKAQDKMEIITNNKLINETRKENLELLWGEHSKECSDCIYEYNCGLKKISKKLGVEGKKYSKRKEYLADKKFDNYIKFQRSKCIDCRNCVEACQLYSTGHLEIKDKGNLFRVEPSIDPKKQCIYCGQCLMHCPVGAFEGISDFEELENKIKDKKTTVVFQIAPSIRTSIGEEFGLLTGEDLSLKVFSAIKKLGVTHVFDTAVGADFTTTEEAKKCYQKIINNKKGVLFTSCCPSWVRYLELYYPKFKNNLATTRSPQIILGSLIKFYWAKKQNIKPENVYVVSVMPCISKKYEIERPELRINGTKPVDQVITTRELAFLLFKNKINPLTEKNTRADDLFQQPSGAGVIYGASGGVMESALRTVANMFGDKQVEFKEVRGLDNHKEKTVKIKGKIYKMAVVNSVVAAKDVLEKLKHDPEFYDFVEVMACPGGCIGGGGQPVPSYQENRTMRAKGLYLTDKQKSERIANKNPVVEDVYKEFLTSDEIIKKYLETEFK